MKKFIFYFLLIFAALFALSACTDTGDNTDGDFTGEPEIDYTDGLNFKLNADGESYSVSQGMAKESVIKIPPEHEGLPVTEIAREGFKNATISRVVLPDSIKVINGYAFYDSTVYEINFPTGLEKIGSHAFLGSKLKEAIIPDNVTELGQYAFAGCKDIKTLKIGKNIRSIEFSTFEQCQGLEELTIPANIETVKADAFRNCWFKSVKIETGVKNIWTVFNDCTYLETIYVPGTVTSFREDFQNCHRLKTLTYGGTKADWEKLEFITPKVSFTIVCTDGEITK